MKDSKKAFDLCVVGLGYVGLPTAALAAKSGLKVLGVDIDARRIAMIQGGKIDGSEPHLNSLVSEVVEEGKLELSCSLEGPSETYVIAVPTPSMKGSFDSRFVDAAVDLLAPSLRGDELIILESTCPPGTTVKLKERILRVRDTDALKHLAVAHCPERVLPGNVVKEIAENDRIIGGVDTRSAKRAVDFYSKFSVGKLWQTDSATAEMAKLVENAYRDVNIAFANEISMIAHQSGVEIDKLIYLANQHPRVNILNPGIGVGGHCICVDPYFLIESSPHYSKLLSAAREVNDQKTNWAAEQLSRYFDAQSPAKVGWLGLAYKANSSDARNSPSVKLLCCLADAYPNVRFSVHDPYISELPQDLRGYLNVSFQGVSQIERESDVVVAAVLHNQYSSLELEDFTVSGLKLVKRANV